jgi:uncharacterized protein
VSGLYLGINMSDFVEIKLEDKALFDKYLKQYNPKASELTFTNLFMWRYFYKFKFAELNGLLCLISEPEEGSPYSFMPIGEIKGDNFVKAVSYIKDYFIKRGRQLQFRRITEGELINFKGFVSDKDIIFDRDNSDYIYMAEELINLSGKKFDGKRNHINKFKKLYEYEYIPLTNEHLGHCRRIMDDWCAQRDCRDHKGLYCEKLANMELLNNFDSLGCKGAIIKVEGNYCAFTVGEMLNSDTAVIHIEKANSKINGIYTYINRQFCAHEWRGAVYINREQDLGIEGLRKAKFSYNPVKISNKYIVNLF